jgi:hypothetical protein
MSAKMDAVSIVLIAISSPPSSSSSSPKSGSGSAISSLGSGDGYCGVSGMSLIVSSSAKFDGRGSEI